MMHVTPNMPANENAPRYLSCAETAKLIRKTLKEAFPGVGFSVRSSEYAGGASVDVRWTDGPTRADVERIAKTFQGATFDGMTDCKDVVRKRLDGERVHFGADFVCCERHVSDAYAQRLWDRYHAMPPAERAEWRADMVRYLPSGYWESATSAERQRAMTMTDPVRLKPQPSATLDRLK
jgi:hypothetical protein